MRAVRHSGWLIVVSLLGLVACDKGGGDSDGEAADHTPHWTAEMLPEPLRALRFGESTESTLTTLFTGSRVDRDQSFGGTMSVQLNDRPAVVVANPYWPGDPQPVLGYTQWTFHLLPAADGAEPTLARLEVRQPAAAGSLCDWLGEHVGSLDGATTCSHTNQETGESGGQHLYCVGSTDGSRAIEVSCRSNQDGSTSLEYWPR